MKKFIYILLFFPLSLFGQTYPSPTFNSLTLQNPLTPANGGTGVNNGSNVLTLGGNFTTSGGFPITLTATGSTSLTLPTSGTLLNTSTAAGTYAPLASPTFSGSVVIPGGSINGTSVGSSSPSSGAFTSLSANSSFSAPNLVTNSDLALVPAWTMKCNDSSSSSTPSDCHLSTINAEDYGVVGDGITDNSTSMSNAISACIARGGCNLQIGTETGVNFLMHGVQIAGNAVHLICSKGVVLINNSTNNYTIQFGNGTTTYDYNSISGCQFTQKSGVTSVSGNYALSINMESFFHADSILVLSTQGPSYNGLYVNNVYEGWFKDTLISGALNNGITINLGNNLYFVNADAESNANYGWQITATNGMFGTNVQGGGNGIAWYLGTGSGGRCPLSGSNCNFFFNGAIGDDSASYDWEILSLNQSVMSQIWASNQQSHSSPASASALYLAGSQVYDDTFDQIQTFDANSDCIHVANSGGMPTNISFSNVELFNCGLAGSGYALNVDNAVSAVSILGGMTGNAASGVVNAGSSATVLVKNLQGYTPASIVGSVSSMALTTSTFTNAASISLSPGTWDVYATAQFGLGSGASSAYSEACLSNVSAACGSVSSGYPIASMQSSQTAAYAQTMSLMPYRITVTSPTTIYLIAYSVFSGGTQSVSGYIRAVPAS